MYSIVSFDSIKDEIVSYEIKRKVDEFDILTRGNPYLLENMIEQEFLILHPECDNTFPRKIHFIGDFHECDIDSNFNILK